jgi:hypothetical protein
LCTPAAVARARHIDSVGNTVNSDHLTCLTDHVGNQEGHVTGSGANVEHAHAGSDARVVKDLLGNRADEPRLHLQALDFLAGMTQHVCLGGIRVADCIIHGHPGSPVAGK